MFIKFKLKQINTQQTSNTNRVNKKQQNNTGEKEMQKSCVSICNASKEIRGPDQKK